MSVKIALAGNPNCGKTTLFNALTGSNQFVGNWPGVTVEKKEGKLKGHKDVILTDLPGIYSLSPYTLEEVVARNYILQEKPDAIINIVDGTNIERNLYLTTQILELGIPVIMAVNMMDIVEKNGDTIHIDKLKKKLGCEVVTISALKGTGITEAANKAVSIAQSHRKVTPVHEFCDKAEEIIGAVENKLTGVVPEEQKRFFAIKLLERDDKIIEQMNTSVNVSAEIKEMENEFDDDTESIITNERYVYISSIIGQCVTKARKDKLSTSDKIDRIVTNRWLALPIFAVVMFIVYYVSVTTVGAFVTDWTNDVLFGEIIPPAIESGLNAIGCAAWLQGLILDGIVAGVGAVLGFVPQMLVLFAFLAFLESCGYMARVAFIMDRIFRKFGLSGKSFIPMLIGSGCGVPGVMASRTIENDRDRKMTIMTTTFVPCGAKLPIIAMIAGAFFNNSGWVATSSYFVGIAAIICSGIILKKTKPFSGKPAPFVMELPEYHIPSVKTVLLHVWERLKAFLIKAGTILVVACIVIWFLSTFGFEGGSFGMVEDTANSLIAVIGNVIAPIFAPLGFGNWQSVASSLTGFSAKEAIVSTMGVLANVSGDTEDAVTVAQGVASWFPSTIAAFTFLLFNLLDSPCLAAIATMAQQMQSKKWFWFAILFQNIFAYIVCLIVYQVGSFVTGGAFGIGTAVGFIFLIALLFMLFRPDPYKNQKVYSKRSVQNA